MTKRFVLFSLGAACFVGVLAIAQAAALKKPINANPPSAASPTGVLTKDDVTRICHINFMDVPLRSKRYDSCIKRHTPSVGKTLDHGTAKWVKVVNNQPPAPNHLLTMDELTKICNKQYVDGPTMEARHKRCLKKNATRIGQPLTKKDSKDLALYNKVAR